MLFMQNWGECVLVFTLAIVIDFIWGDPVYAFHPVRLIGKLITGTEALLRRIGLSGKVGGVFLVAIVVGVSTGTYLSLRYGVYYIHPWLVIILDVFLAYSCIAFQDLFSHARKVADALEGNGLEGAQNAVQMIVGRDATQLDANGVARAAVESVAESFVDGFLSPVFWFVLGAICSCFAGISPCLGAVISMLAYRTINTMDSMIGYRNQRYIHFGRVAAKLDDAANFFPARLALPIISLAAFLSGNNWKKCIKIGLEDRLKHSSPNAGHTESCVAGALDIRLGGPTLYSSGLVEKPWLGEGSRNIKYDHIRHCCRLILWSGVVAFTVSFFIFIVLFTGHIYKFLP